MWILGFGYGFPSAAGLELHGEIPMQMGVPVTVHNLIVLLHLHNLLHGFGGADHFCLFLATTLCQSYNLLGIADTNAEAMWLHIVIKDMIIYSR